MRFKDFDNNKQIKPSDNKVLTTQRYKPVKAMIQAMGALQEPDLPKGSYIDVWDSGKNFKPKKNNQ
jgi:hypothetical protein